MTIVTAISWATLVSTILFGFAVSQTWAESGKGTIVVPEHFRGIVRVSNPPDWQLADIGLQIRKVAKPIRRGMGLDYEELARRFDNRKFSCAITVKPDGSLVNLKVYQTSGSEQIDQKGLDLIRAAAPFRPQKLLDDRKYLVEFPRLTVQSID